MSLLQLSALDDYCDDIGGTNSTIYSDASKHRAYDRWSNNIIAEIMESMQGYDFQGEISTHDLNAGQREYLFPTDLLKIKRIDLKLDGINWKKAGELDANQVGDAYAQESDITSRFFNSEPFIDYLDNSFVIYSGTITDVTGGIKLTYAKEIVGQDNSGADIVNFTSDTDKSNLPEFAQMALVYGALIDFFTDRSDNNMLAKFNIRLYGNPTGRPSNAQMIGGLMKQIKDYYTSKSPDQLIALSAIYDERSFN